MRYAYSWLALAVNCASSVAVRAAAPPVAHGHSDSEQVVRILSYAFAELVFHTTPPRRQNSKSLAKTKESDLETLDKIITDRELEELLDAHGIN